jgi:hypothetical protein
MKRTMTARRRRSKGGSRSRWLGAGLALVLVAAAATAEPAGDSAQAALPDPAGANPPKVSLNAVYDLRSVDTGLTIYEGSVWVWGNGYYGMNGAYQDATLRGHTSDDPPHKVNGLPDGSIVHVAGGIYNFNALDNLGYVWGWGSYPYRDGTGKKRGSDYSEPPQVLRIGGNWDDTSAPYLSDITKLSGTEMAGAAIAQDGRIYSWGHQLYGGNTPSSTNAGTGASLVQGLPDPSLPGNMPVYIKGGYTTFWVMLENGDIYYFGGQNEYERPAGDEPTDFSGTTRRGLTSKAPDMGANPARPVWAMKSQALDGWTRQNSPDEYVIQ